MPAVVEAEHALDCDRAPCHDRQHPGKTAWSRETMALVRVFASVAEDKCATHDPLSLQKRSTNLNFHEVPSIWCAVARIPNASTPWGRSYSDKMADAADRAIFRPPLADFATATGVLPINAVGGDEDRDSVVGDESVPCVPETKRNALEQAATRQGEPRSSTSATDSNGPAASYPLSSKGDDDIDQAFRWSWPQIEDLSSDAMLSQESSGLSPVSLHPQDEGTSISTSEPTGAQNCATDLGRWMGSLAGDTEMVRPQERSLGLLNDTAKAQRGGRSAAPQSDSDGRTQDKVTGAVSEEVEDEEEEPPWMAHLRYCRHCATIVAERGQGHRARDRVPPTHGPHTASNDSAVMSKDNHSIGAESSAALPDVRREHIQPTQVPKAATGSESSGQGTKSDDRQSSGKTDLVQNMATPATERSEIDPAEDDD